MIGGGGLTLKFNNIRQRERKSGDQTFSKHQIFEWWRESQTPVTAESREITAEIFGGTAGSRVPLLFNVKFVLLYVD